MKLQCDVCDKAQASVMCCADEAALCADCDTRVHAANKLASKHQRVPLLCPSAPDDSPCCDICQEKTGYFFCLEDRALLCRNCDFSIHSVNVLASKHSRFLVTGIRVALQAVSGQDRVPEVEIGQVNSPRQVPPTVQAKSSRTPLPQQQTASLSVPPSSQQPKAQQLSMIPQASSKSGVSPKTPATSPAMTAPLTQQLSFPSGRPSADWNTRPNMVDVNSANLKLAGFHPSHKGGGGFVRRSSISEYLIETIPGWKVDELLNLPDSSAIYNFAEPGSSKTDASSFGDLDWAAEFSALDEQILGESLAEVPSIPSPPTASGFPRPLRVGGSGKGKRRPDFAFLVDFEDTLVVPDTGGQSSPALSPTSPPQKRRRAFV